MVMINEREFDLIQTYKSYIDLGISHFKACDMLGLSSRKIIDMVGRHNPPAKVPAHFSKPLASFHELVMAFNDVPYVPEAIMNQLAPYETMSHGEMIKFYENIRNRHRERAKLLQL